jgi:fucose permease
MYVICIMVCLFVCVLACFVRFPDQVREPEVGNRETSTAPAPRERAVTRKVHSWQCTYKYIYIYIHIQIHNFFLIIL